MPLKPRAAGVNITLTADSISHARALFEACLEKTDKLHYDGELVLGEGGAAQIYVFGEPCPDCGGRGWHYKTDNTHGMDPCLTCNGKKQVMPEGGFPQ